MIFGEFAEYLVAAELVPQGGYSYVKGVWTADPPGEPPEEEPDYTIAIIKPQALRSDEIDMMPSGEFVHNYRKTWTSYDIGVWGFGEAPYDLTYSGKTYKVVQVNDWTEYDNFRRIIIREKKANE